MGSRPSSDDRGGFHHLGQHRRARLAPVFLINIILGLVGLLAAFTLLPVTGPVQRGDRRHRRGAARTSMLALIFGLIQGSTDGWRGVPVVSLVAGVLLFAAFAFDSSGPQPLIVTSLLKNRGFTSGCSWAWVSSPR